MGHCCSKDDSGNAVATLDDGGGGSATPNNHHLPNAHASPPSPPPMQPGGNVTVEAHSSQNTPAHSLAASPWQSVYPPGIAPSPSPAGTPRRKFKWPFPPPSPAKPIMSTLLRRLGAAASSSQSPNERPVPRESDGSEGGQRALDKSFGYANNFTYMFELGKVLGRGHFGHTCRAKGLKGELKNQPVAVKILSKAQMTTPLSIEDVRREVKILKALSGHQNLIQFYDAFEDEQHVFIVMELCEGGELFDRIVSRGGQYKEEDAKRVVVQILNAVTYIHLQGVVHRDLKPENFLFANGAEGAPMKLIDFGLSNFIKPDQRLSDVVGSAFYVAPEVLHRSYSVDADMWSIGVITYILLCGSRPFWGRTESGIFRSVLQMEPNFEDGPWRGVSTKAKDFVRRLLIKDHRKRMTAAQALTHPWLSAESPAVPLDILIFKLVKSYVEASPLRRAALKALSKALTEQELVYLRAQFNLLEPTDGYISFDNFRMALLKNMSDAMRESRVFDILRLMGRLSHEQMEFEEFCAAVINPIQLEALENWEQMARTAYEHFEQGNREISVQEIAEEENLGPMIPSIVKQWVRSDGRLSFLGFTKILHGSTVHGPGARLRRQAGSMATTTRAHKIALLP